MAVYFFDCPNVNSYFNPLIYKALHVAMIMLAKAGLFTSRNAEKSCFASARRRFLVLEDLTQLICPVFFSTFAGRSSFSSCCRNVLGSQVQGFVAKPSCRHSAQHVGAFDYTLAPCALNPGENPRRFWNFASYGQASESLQCWTHWGTQDHLSPCNVASEG